MSSMDSIRADFPMLLGKDPPVYLDNAASSLTPKPVLDAVSSYYASFRANIHRGMHKPSEDATRAYEDAHAHVESLLRAPRDSVVFTRNATESINLVMNSLDRMGHFKAGGNIVVSAFEHHANLVPWQFVAKKHGLELRIAPLTADYVLDMDAFSSLVDSKTQLVAVTHAANTTGSIVDVSKAAAIAHDAGAPILVDGAQSVPHFEVDVKKLDCDFLAFSSHKMCGPTGAGALYGKKDWLEKMPPFLFGGDMIHTVTYHSASWNRLPYKFEAGTPAIGEGIGFGAAARYLQKTGLSSMAQREHSLVSLALEELSAIPSVRVIGPKNPLRQTGTVLFDVKNLHCHDIALALYETARVCIRSGHHCAQPFVEPINPMGLCRASFYFYNTESEVVEFINALKTVIRTFG